MLIVTCRNLSNLADVSDYEYNVYIAGGTEKRIIASGKVKGHRRSQGWAALLRLVAKHAERRQP